MTTGCIIAGLGNGRYRPTDLASGPFRGMQGGSAAALMAAEIEQRLGDVWMPVSATAHFLKPVPLTDLEVSVTEIRTGRRVAVWDAALASAEGECARIRITLLQPEAIPEIPPPESLRHDPLKGERIRPKAPHGGPWLMDAMDVRIPVNGIFWFRMETPLTNRPTLLGKVLPPADWAHGLDWGAKGKPYRSVGGLPNTDVTVHLSRPVEGEWIGVQPHLQMMPSGVGMCHGQLHDMTGAFGTVAMPVAIMPAGYGQDQR